jgi:phage replication O-like protein O
MLQSVESRYKRRKFFEVADSVIDANVILLERGYTRVPNRLDEAVTAAPFSLTQLKAVRAILRLTYGSRCRTTRISLPELAECCGLAFSRGFRTQFAELLRAGVIIRIARARGRISATYSVQRDNCQWGRFSEPYTGFDAFYDRVPFVPRSPRKPRVAKAPSLSQGDRSSDLSPSDPVEQFIASRSPNTRAAWRREIAMLTRLFSASDVAEACICALGAEQPISTPRVLRILVDAARRKRSGLDAHGGVRDVGAASR